MNKRMICFSNPGEIDPRSIVTFGVNVKENDSPIGFFGTGLKYAIAVLLRTGHRIRVQSGLSTFEFEARPTTIRGREFGLVHMNEEQLAFTTEVGKTWEVWMAYRELYCNVLDEGGRVAEVSSPPTPALGVTTVLVTGDKFATVYQQRSQYFLEGTPEAITSDAEIYSGGSGGIYYKCVLIGKLQNPSLFTYNILKTVALSEDRTFKSTWEIEYYVTRAAAELTNKEMLRLILTAKRGSWEHDFNYPREYVETHPVMIEVIEELIRDRATQINLSALTQYQAITQSKLAPTTKRPTDVEVKMLEKAKQFCSAMGYPIEYEIVIAESLGEGCLGLARDGRIYLAHRLFMQGTKQLTSALLEEYVHLKFGFSDYGPEMQTWLFDKVISLVEELNGEAL